jgi:hypothetical protein
MIDRIIQDIKKGFEQVTEHRYNNAQIKLVNYLQSAFPL